MLEEGKMEKLKFKQIISLTLTLFAVFFGAGNMIFPPAMGQLAGENYWQALIGFILTDAGIALLGIIAVVLVGNEITDLGNLISKKFAVFLSIVVYLLIGPLFALPRTGSVSYELAAKPYVPSEYSWLVSLGVTAVFFAVTYFLSARPNKIVDIIGKYLTPILILSIVAIFFSCLFMDKSNSTVQYGATTATGAHPCGRWPRRAPPKCSCCPRGAASLPSWTTARPSTGSPLSTTASASRPVPATPTRAGRPTTSRPSCKKAPRARWPGGQVSGSNGCD